MEEIGVNNDIIFIYNHAQKIPNSIKIAWQHVLMSLNIFGFK